MTPHQVSRRVVAISAIMHDPEAAHAAEDDLLWAFVQAISNGVCLNPIRCAKEILRLKELNFSRRCA